MIYPSDFNAHTSLYASILDIPPFFFKKLDDHDCKYIYNDTKANLCCKIAQYLPKNF